MRSCSAKVTTNGVFSNDYGVTNSVDPEVRIPDTPEQNIRNFQTIKVEIEEAYETTTKWRKNIFQLPTGKVGKLFVSEMTELINSWCDKTEWRSIALKALLIMPNLLLQKSTSSKN